MTERKTLGVFDEDGLLVTDFHFAKGEIVTVYFGNRPVRWHTGTGKLEILEQRKDEP